MATQLIDELHTDFDIVEKNIEAIVKYYDYSYILSQYVDRNIWTDRIKNSFSTVNVDNTTDFNYSRCFSYSLNDDDIEVSIGNNNFNEHINDKGVLYRTDILISCLCPYFFYRFVRYDVDNSEIKMSCSSDPYSNYQNDIKSLILNFCKKYKLQIIPDEYLKKTIDGIAFELAGNNPSIYNLFFEDNASKFPYE